MPGIDYLGEPYDPRENSYSKSIVFPLALELGGIEGGRWALGKYVKSKQSQASAAGSIIRTEAHEANVLRRGLGGLSKKFLYSGVGILGFTLASSIVGASRSFATSTDEIMKSRYRGYYSGADEYFDSRAAMTQRQRALQVIHNSQMSTRASFGNESSYMHY